MKEKNETIGCILASMKLCFFLFAIMTAFIGIEGVWANYIHLTTVIPKYEQNYIKVYSLSPKGNLGKYGTTKYFANGYLINTDSVSVILQIPSALTKKIYKKYIKKEFEFDSEKYDTIIPLMNPYEKKKHTGQKNSKEIALTKFLEKNNNILPIWYYPIEKLPTLSHVNATIRYAKDGEPYLFSRKTKPLLIEILFLLPSIIIITINLVQKVKR